MPAPRTRTMTTANKITLVRIFMIPMFVMMAIYYGRGLVKGDPQEWQRWLALGIFGLAAASDGIDGYIARRYNQRSALGVILDPIADKGLLLSGIITLAISDWNYEFPLWFPVLVISRDAVVVLGAAVLHLLNGQVQIRPSWTGKTATALQMVALVLVMLQYNPFVRKFQLGAFTLEVSFLDLPVYVAGLFTAVSGFGYIMDGIAQLHARGHGEPIGSKKENQ
jgi:CDP-diacylglycerol--glycerol-3-phosphate 3-phosphatidyltransferase